MYFGIAVSQYTSSCRDEITFAKFDTLCIISVDMYIYTVDVCFCLSVCQKSDLELESAKVYLNHEK